MTGKDTASANLSRRPDEEHFKDMKSLLDSARKDKEDQHEIRLPDEKVKFLGGDDVNLGGDKFKMSPWLWAQVAKRCRVPMPVLNRMSEGVRTDTLNDLWPNGANSATNPLVWLVDPVHGSIRSVTTTVYHRIWDADLYGDVDRWVGGAGWVPAYPEINSDAKGTNINGNTKPALFRGDRDSFVFFMSDRNPKGDDGLGGLRRGLTVWNSEVGGRGIGFTTFYFRAICANFLVWGQKEEVIVKGRHVSSANQAWDILKEKVVEIGSTLTTAELDNFTKADEKKFVPIEFGHADWASVAKERLKNMKVLPSHVYNGVLDGDILHRSHNMTNNPGSHFHLANGVTDYAKGLSHAATRLEVQAAAGRIMAKAL